MLLRVQAIIVAIDQYVEGSSRRPEPQNLRQEWVKSITSKGDGHEAKSVHGRTDHRDPAGAGGRGRRQPMSAASTGSAARPSTNGRPSTAGWKCPIPDTKRLKALEDENAKLKRLLAEATLVAKRAREIDPAFPIVY